MAQPIMDMAPAAISRMKLLTMSGALPFYAAIFLTFFPMVPINAALIAVTYGALIIAFLCGTQWGFYVLRSSDVPFDLTVISNVITLVAWATPFLMPVPSALLILSLIHI